MVPYISDDTTTRLNNILMKPAMLIAAVIKKPNLTDPNTIF
jgi:hypothetical protein